MNSNTSISGWHRHGHGTVQQCRMPELLGIPVSADSRLAGMSSPYNTHTHCQKLPPPPSLDCECRGRQVCRCFLQEALLSPPSRACHRPLPSRHWRQAFLCGLHPIRTAQLSALFFCNRAAGISPRQHVPGTGGKRCQWKEDSGTSRDWEALWCHAKEGKF